MSFDCVPRVCIYMYVETVISGSDPAQWSLDNKINRTCTHVHNN